MTGEGIEELNYLIGTLLSTYDHIFVGGDMKGKHPSWCPVEHTDPHLYRPSIDIGLRIRGILASNNLQVLNSATCPLTFLSMTGAPSWIDVSASSQSIFITSWLVVPDSRGCYDHFLISCEIALPPPIVYSSVLPRSCWTRTHWSNVHYHL